MVVYTFIPFDSFALKLLCRVALLPLIAGISYEMIRFAAKRRGPSPAIFSGRSTPLKSARSGLG